MSSMLPVDNETLLSSVEQTMTQYIDQRAMAGNLREAIRYALIGGGKRLRPMLVIRCCEAVGGAMSSALAPAAAIEMVHTFSLVHDDLPAMDDDDLRRGRPTLHKHASEAMAILAGDAMLGLAFELLLTEADAAVAPLLSLELIRANNDMITGQVHDTLPDFDADLPEMDRLRTIHHHKTGALIRCACRMGAMAGGASPTQLAAVTRYAVAIGLMFQVVDDILDVTQSTEHLGKTAGKDIQQGKLTYPSLIGLDASRQVVADLQIEAHDALKALEETGDEMQLPRIATLRELCDYLAVRSR
jgi:geranylgeranyl diphosphate synthase type II